MLKTKIILAMWRGTYFWSLNQISGIARPCFWTHIIFIRTSCYGCFTFLAGYSLKNFSVSWFENSRCFSDFWRWSVSFIRSSTCSWWPPSSGDYDWFVDLVLIFFLLHWLCLETEDLHFSDSWPVSDFTDTSEFQRHFRTWVHFITTLASRITVL